jgi:VIT1/CCC1 family predicted Fe2+/Mn2+ transporter
VRAHARDELNLDVDNMANPLQAALASGVAFTVGAGIPLAAGARGAAARGPPQCPTRLAAAPGAGAPAPDPRPAALAGAAVQQQPGRVVSVAIVTTVALVVLGSVSAYLGGAKRLRAAVRVVLGGWLAMGLTFGIGKAFGGNIMA